MRQILIEYHKVVMEVVLCVLDTITANKTVQNQAASERRSKIHGCCVTQQGPENLSMPTLSFFFLVRASFASCALRREYFEGRFGMQLLYSTLESLLQCSGCSSSKLLFLSQNIQTRSTF